MPHLAVFRRGWQNEHFAAFILSKFAFVAHPAKIGDDIGTDFFCTFFETVRQGGKDYLVPKNSFAIQVKSTTRRTLNFTKQIDYLLGLELPFFVGIVDKKISKLSIYSGEYLPVLFPAVGRNRIATLTLELRANHDFEPIEHCQHLGDGKYRLRCPKVSTLSAVMTDEEIAAEAERLRKVARRIQKNIATGISEQHIYDIGPDGNTPFILAGSGSFQVFRKNFKKRLAEVFWNLTWIYNHPELNLDISEFRFYEAIYDQMHEREGPLPEYLTQVAEPLKERLASS